MLTALRHKQATMEIFRFYPLRSLQKRPKKLECKTKEWQKMMKLATRKMRARRPLLQEILWRLLGRLAKEWWGDCFAMLPSFSKTLLPVSRTVGAFQNRIPRSLLYKTNIQRVCNSLWLFKYLMLMFLILVSSNFVSLTFLKIVLII